MLFLGYASQAVLVVILWDLGTKDPKAAQAAHAEEEYE